MGQRVVITAMGAVTSLGSRLQEIKRSIQKGHVTFQASTGAGDAIVAPVRDFGVRQFTGRHKNLRYLNRGAAMAVAAAVSAVHNAGISRSQLEGGGIFVGAGPNLDLGGECARIEAGRISEDQLSALWILRFLPNTAASTIAQLTGIRGENLTLGNACAASLQAIGEAFRKIKHGDLDLAVAGGGDSRLSDGALLAYQKARALYTGNADPKDASRPFDQARRGFVPGEGGAFFVLESERHAAGRNAKVMAEICGYGASVDGHAMTAPQPDGQWAENAVRRALDDARTDPAAVDMISSHGTGTLLNDEVEAAMIQRIFQERRPGIVAIKSWIGHLASACGAAELAVCLAALQTGVWPKIRNLESPSTPGLNYLVVNSAIGAGTIVLQNFGFGGQNAALVVRKWKP